MSPKSLNINNFLIKSTFKQLSPADKLTYITYCIGLVSNTLILIINTVLNFEIPKNVSIFIIASMLIGWYLYFHLQKPFISSVFVITSLNISSFYLCYNLGLTTSYFTYVYVILCTIPFVNKRDKNYFKNSLILSLITLFFAIINIVLSPQYNLDNLLIDGANQKLLTNSIISFILFLVFVFIMIFAFSNIILALIKAKINAVKQKDTKTRILSNLGHELRTQLSSIHGITQLILVQNKNELLSNNTFSQYTETLEVCSNQMLFLVNDILDIHKIESGNFKLNSKPENLFQLLNQAVIPFKNKAHEKDLVFDVSIDPILKNDYVNLDASRLTQVIQNLISNAINYTEKGFIKFIAKIEYQDHEQSTILFSVKDSGIGISEDNLLKVFDSFQQIRDEKTTNTGGTGLGLAISKTIVEKMDSQININSTLNIGSDFNFTLKLTKVPNLSEQKIEVTGTKLFPSILDGKKILIAEDNKISMLYASKLLEKNNAKVLKAYNGLEAIQAAETHPNISLVLLDLEMPEMNGFTAIKHIKKTNAALKVIAFTANIPDDILLEKLNKLNFDDFLAKPFRNEDMFSILNKYLD
ncbi:hybrid sensor histidine kinase/response regulator [Psychroserpens luteus]|uniref:histidine kinase n=1 Tax=Psychroserpens luteus TaxID=1434066 RepID=A0ABW5ZX52_9FLAO|nr:ATP-binding protein [Psychroserpens luteus]